MHTARTLLVLVSFVGGLMEVALAQHKYIFPQFAFGGGWESTLMVQALVDGNTTCTFSAQGRFFTMRYPGGNSFSEHSSVSCINVLIGPATMEISGKTTNTQEELQ